MTMEWFNQILFGNMESVGQLVLRITLAVVLWPHGAQKVLGAFGGGGWSGTYEAFTRNMGIPAPLAVVAMLTEFLAPAALVLGLMTRLAALGCAILMLTAMRLHVRNGFFSNWSGKQAGEGIEYHILFAGAALALCLTGPGAYSMDAWLASL